MKRKLFFWLKLVLILGLGVLSCYGIYYFVDTFLNGTFVDWFMDSFIRTYQMVDEYGNYYFVTEPVWSALKLFMAGGLILLVAIVILLVYFISYFHAKRKVKKSISETGKMIRLYLNNSVKSAELFPADYAEIATQMVWAKSAITEREQRWKEETSRKNELITYLAHDLKTPLTSVIGYLSLLDEIPELPDQQRKKYIRTALEKAECLERHINEFFEITRYNLHQMILEPERIDLSYLLAQMTDEFYPILSSHKNTVKLEVEDGLTVLGDADKLARVFHNLLKNAIHYSYPETEIVVGAGKRDGNVVVTFSNHGKNIPEHKLEVIFERFFRLDEARVSNTGGAGLGLAIAKEIVILHGGTIAAKSSDQETVFTVTLPLES